MPDQFRVTRKSQWKTGWEVLNSSSKVCFN
jgi:hypothetical protein